MVPFGGVIVSVHVGLWERSPPPHLFPTLTLKLTLFHCSSRLLVKCQSLFSPDPNSITPSSVCAGPGCRPCSCSGLFHLNIKTHEKVGRHLKTHFCLQNVTANACVAGEWGRGTMSAFVMSETVICFSLTKRLIKRHNFISLQSFLDKKRKKKLL